MSGFRAKCTDFASFGTRMDQLLRACFLRANEMVTGVRLTHSAISKKDIGLRMG